MVRDPGAPARSVRDRQPDGGVAAIGQELFERSIDRLEWVLALMPVLVVTAGHRNRDIARELNMSLGTVKNRLFTAYCRLQAPNRAAAVTAWLRMPGGSQ